VTLVVLAANVGFDLVKTSTSRPPLCSRGCFSVCGGFDPISRLTRIPFGCGGVSRRWRAVLPWRSSMRSSASRF
jgi:hypothetical protein